MRLFKKFISAMIIISVLLSFSGCSLKLTSFENLIRPPKLSGKYQGLQDSFEKAVNSFALVTPENGQYQSAFVTFDIDSDSEEEALVFYKTDDTSEEVNVYYFEFDNDEWIPVSTVTGYGSSVDFVSFSDLNSDKKLEIIIGWSLFSSTTNRVFSVYCNFSNSITEIGNYPYSSLKLLDVNGNGSDDIFTISVSNSVDNEISASAKVYSYDKKTNMMNVIGETKADGNISSYENIFVENNNGKNYIYVDTLMGDNGMFTDIFYWDDDKNTLISPLFDSTTQSTKSTWRSSKISCTDIDSDNLYEIPVSVEMKGSSDSQSSTSDSTQTESTKKLYYIRWDKFSDDSLNPVCYSVINEDFDYMLELKSSMVGRITVLSVDGQWDFYRYDSSQENVGDLLFSIYAYNNTNVKISEKYSDYTLLKTNGSLNYVYKITEEGSNFGISEDDITAKFRIF